MRYDISKKKCGNFGLRRPRGATRPLKCFCFCSLFRKGHHCGNKLFPVSVSVILTEKPIADLKHPPEEGTGTRPDYLVNRVLTKKMRGHLGKKIARISRNSCKTSGGGVGAWGQLTRGSNGLSPRTKYKRSRNTFEVTSIALSCSHV